MYCNKINICIPWKHSLTYRLWHKLKNQMVVVIKWALYVSINIADVQNHYNLNKEWHAHHHSTYIHTDMEATYFWDYAFLPFSLWEWFNALPNGWGVCRPGLLDIVTKKKGYEKKRKEAPCLHLWSVSVTAWSAISSSPTEAVSCAAGKQPRWPPAPRTLAVGAGGLCSTWPHPGMTSTGTGKWTGRGGGGTVSSHRLQTRNQDPFITILVCKWAFEFSHAHF